MADNGVNEVDVVKHHYQVGPAVKAILFFLILVTTVGATWYICKENTKGDIAVSEIEIRKADDEVAIELEEDHKEDVEATQNEVKNYKLEGDWTSKSLYELKHGVQQPEID